MQAPDHAERKRRCARTHAVACMEHALPADCQCTAYDGRADGLARAVVLGADEVDTEFRWPPC